MIILFLLPLLFKTTSSSQQSEPTTVEPSTFYMISLPKALLHETEHNFFIQIPQSPALLRIDSRDPVSGLQVQGYPSVLRQSISQVSYQIPFARFPSAHLQLTFYIDICREPSCSANSVIGSFLTKTVLIPVMRNNFIIFGETSKPIYRPGELVRFRFLSVYPTSMNFKRNSFPRFEIISSNYTSGSKYILENIAPNTNNLPQAFTEIYLEDITPLRMAQWRNISWEKAMFLKYRLSPDAINGKWKIIANLNGQTETISFQVMKYILPKFTVNIKPPASLLISDKNVSFSVCARYSTGGNVKAIIRGSLCVKPVNIADTRPCIQIIDILPGNIECKDFISDTAVLKLRSRHFKYWNTRLILKIEVEEDGTGIKEQVEHIGVALERTRFTIALDSLDYYKPGLPYYGRVRTQYHNGMRYPYGRIEVSIVSLSYNSKWGFAQQYETDDQGELTFFMPPFPPGQDYSLKVQEIRVEETKRPYFLRMAPAILTKTVTSWHSIHGTYLQLYPISDGELNTAACTKTLKVYIQSNLPLNSKYVYAHVLSRGQLVSMQEMSPESFKNKKSCEPRDDELGHYICTGGEFGDQILIQCMEGWSGQNCLTPICLNPCVNGICTEPGRCLCKEGWKGQQCNICEPRKGCLNGNCVLGNDCQCWKGWRGYLCDKQRTMSHGFSENFAFRNKLNYVSREKSSSGRSYFHRSKRSNPFLHPSMFFQEIQEKLIFSREVHLEIPSKATPNAHVVVYFKIQVNNATEIVAESFDIDNIGTCGDKSKYIFSFDRNIAEPGSQVFINIQPNTKKNKCSLRITDMGLKKYEDSNRIDMNSLFEKLNGVNKKIRHLSKRDLYNRISKKGCKKTDRKAIKGMKIYFSNKFDSNKAFNHAGVFALTNAQLMGDTCDTFPTGLEQATFTDLEVVDSSHLDTEVIMREFSINKAEFSTHLRNFLPETWKFEYMENPKAMIPLKVPDSITTWKADIYCLTEKGLWIAPSTYLTVKAPFYVDVVLPYSIKYQEIIDIPVRLFNYLSQCYELRVEIILPQEFRTVRLIGKRSITTCICDLENKIVTFQIIPISIGQIDIIVQADATQSSFCSNRGRRSTKLVNSDAVSRGVRVEPGGVAKEFTVADLLCLKNETIYVRKEVQLPSNTFPGSERGYLIYSGDVMGTTLANLDQLLNLPHGCGEQNMARMVPSIYVLDYFKALNLKRPNVAKKAKDYMEVGYAEQMKYRRHDGSFTAFGDKDNEGSTWLTAFVYKSFNAAKTYINVDESILQKALEFIESRQMDNGCFEERGSTFSSSMKGGVNREDSSNLLLTAYVLTSISVESKSISQPALDCLRYNLNPNSRILDKMSNYSLALMAYAFSVHDPNGMLTQTLATKLLNRSITLNGIAFWSDNPRHTNRPLTRQDYKTSDFVSNSIDVETTAYAYLALEKVQPLVTLMRYIRWLTRQRNAIGGFKSTQDTVMGLKALSNFARRLDLTVKTNVEVNIKAGTFTKQDRIKEADSFLTRNVKIEGESPKTISWNLTGSGCIYIQSVIFYNLMEEAKTDAPFSMSSHVTQYPSTCNDASVSVCFSYRDTSRTSGMILVTLSLVSGWDIAEPIDETAKGLKLVEKKQGNISLYFDAIPAEDKDLRCFKVKLRNIHKIKNTKQGVITIIDYYEPDRSIHRFYSLKSCPSTLKLVQKSLQFAKRSCPLCFIKPPSDLNELNGLFRSMICPKSRSALVYGNANNRRIRTYFLPLQNRFYEWSSEFIPDTCGCVNSSLPNEPLLIVTNKRWKLYPGEVVSPDGDFLVTRPEFLAQVLSERVPAHCQLVSPLRRMIDRISFQYDRRDISLQENCPICLEHYSNSMIAMAQRLLCRGELVAAKYNGTSGWKLSIASFPVRVVNSDVYLDPACECNINAISKRFDRNLWIVGPHTDINYVTEKNPLEPSGNYLITHEGTYRAFAKHCDTPVRNAFVIHNDWSEFLG